MRGLEIDKRSFKKLYKSLRFTLVPLIVSALAKVDSLVISMEGRAFGFKPARTFIIEDRYGARDKLLTAASLACVAVLLAGKPLGWRLLRGPSIHSWFFCQITALNSGNLEIRIAAVVRRITIDPVIGVPFLRIARRIKGWRCHTSTGTRVALSLTHRRRLPKPRLRMIS
jgi:hypothetical protein